MTVREKLSKREAGRLGGLATVEKHGREHMRAIGKRGYAAAREKYRFPPGRLKKWLRKYGTRMRDCWK
jgi:hypothetical protein